MVENKLFSDKGTNKASQGSLAMDSILGHAPGILPGQMNKTEHTRSKEIQNMLIEPRLGLHQKTTASPFSRFQGGTDSNLVSTQISLPNFQKNRSSNNQDAPMQTPKSNYKTDRSLKLNRSKSGFKGFHGTKKRSSRIPPGSQNRNHSQPIGQMEPKTPKGSNKRAGNDPMQDMIMNHYYPLSSMDKRARKYSNMKAINIQSKTRLEKLKGRWNTPVETIFMEEANQRVKSTASNKPFYGNRQYGNIRAKKNTFKMTQFDRSFPKKVRPFGSKKQASVPQRKAYTSRTSTKKANTNERTKSKSKMNELKYKTSRLKAAHQKIARSGVMDRNKTHLTRGYKAAHQIKNYGKASRIDGHSKRQREKERNFRRIKAATTSINKRSHLRGGSRSGYVKKRAIPSNRKQLAPQFGGGRVKEKRWENSYSQRQKKIGRTRMGMSANLKKSSVSKTNASLSKNKKIGSIQGKRTQSTYKSKYSAKSGISTSRNVKKEKKPIKRYFLKGHKPTKEKQLKRELRLKEEMKKHNEQKKSKKENHQISNGGSSYYGRKSESSTHERKILSTRQAKDTDKNPQNLIKGFQNRSSNFPKNKLKNFRESMKTGKQNKKTQSPIGIKKRTLLNSQKSRQLQRKGTRKIFNSLNPERIVSKVQRLSQGVNLEERKKVIQRRSRRQHEENKIRSLQHQRTNREVKLALEEVEGNLKEIDSIRRSGLREKTARSLSKKMQKWKLEYLGRNIGEDKDPFNVNQIGNGIDKKMPPDILQIAKLKSQSNEKNVIKKSELNDDLKKPQANLNKQKQNKNTFKGKQKYKK